MTNNRILFVTNDYNTRENYLNLLDKYEVVVATDTETAFKELGRQPADIVIIDFRLVDDEDERDYSGLDLATRLPRDIPKIILTAHPGTPITSSLPISNTHIISKSESPDVFLNTLKGFFRDVNIEDDTGKQESTMNDVVKKTLHLTMDGKAFQKGIYIHTVVDSLNELQFILDRSYLALVNKKNLTPKERTYYKLVAQSFEKGSFVSAIDIVIATAPVVLPLISQIGPENIWEYTKTTFEFLKLVFSLNQEKKSRNDDKAISITGDETTTNVNYGQQTWNFNAPVLLLGESVLPSYKKLSQMVKSNDLEFLQLGSGEKDPEIRIDQKDNNLFDVKPEILRTPIRVNARFLT